MHNNPVDAGLVFKPEDSGDCTDVFSSAYPCPLDDDEEEDECDENNPYYLGDCDCLNIGCDEDEPEPKDWYKDVDNDGYHDGIKTQLFSPGTGWKEGTPHGEDCDDNDSKYKYANLSVSLTVTNSKQVGSGADFKSGDLTFQDIHNIISNSNLPFLEKIQAHDYTYTDELFDHYMTMYDYIENLRDFAEWTTFNDDLVNEMIDRFAHNESSNHFTSSNLTQSMLGSSGYESFRNSLIELIKSKVEDVTEVSPHITITDLDGPTFDTNGGLFSWNGSHSSKIEAANLVINCETFSMTATLIMYDHFGLDNDDLYSQPMNLNGIDEKLARNSRAMRGWFILQRVKGIKPFVSEVTTTINISNESF